MNTKRIGYLIIILLLAIIAILILIFRNKISTRNPLADFAVEDTAAISRIFIADKSGHQSTLDKVAPGHWRVNGKYDVQPSKMQTLMDVIYRIRIKSPVPKQYRDDVVRILTTSIKVMLYNGDKLIKVYYVGSETPDYLGTYMCLENADDPMITEIPGFNGFLTPRYMTREEDWKTNTIISVAPDKIKTVRVSYDNNPAASFQVNKGSGTYTVNSLDPKVKMVLTNQNKIKEYLELFGNLSMEGYDNRATNAFRDSLNTAVPFVMITVEDEVGKADTVKVFFKILPPGHERLDENNQYSNIDQNRYYAVTNKDTRVMVVQVFNFGRVMQKFDFFR